MASTVDWGKVVLAILDRLLLTQAELAARCKVAQQTVSGWKTGARTPGRYAQRQLVQLAREAGLSASNIPYSGAAAPILNVAEQLPAKTAAGKNADAALKTEWLRLLEALPEAERQELLDYARFKANRKRATATRSQ
jgi:transcriptional regulator with XRE-family HTH domain